MEQLIGKYFQQDEETKNIPTEKLRPLSLVILKMILINHSWENFESYSRLLMKSLKLDWKNVVDNAYELNYDGISN